jgi:hypothetical protein
MKLPGSAPQSAGIGALPGGGVQILSLIRQTPNVELAYTSAQQLVIMVKERNAQPFSTWFRDCQRSGISDLMTLAQGLENERSVFYAALTSPTVMDRLKEKLLSSNT